MGPEWVAILALVALFVMGTVLPLNMGALAYVAAWLVGMYSLIGVTNLFAVAKNNGTVDLPVYYKQILTYSMMVVAAGPLLVRAALVAPGW